MPAVTPTDSFALPVVAAPLAGVERPVRQLVTAREVVEGAGFVVRRPFPGNIDPHLADPFLLLDHLGAVEYAPGEAQGAPWHPHRGFETVTYLLDGALRHTDSNGGGGVIRDGATQWMTAGAGILHDELPTEELVTRGGLFHGVQLWVNLPRRLKWTAPRYQDIAADRPAVLRSEDGGAVLRLIAGELAGHRGPGVTHTPITYAHATVAAGARLSVPWRTEFNALLYVLAGAATVGPSGSPVHEGQLAVFGAGDVVTVTADHAQSTAAPELEVLLLGGQPIREPIARYGPFVMNTRAEIAQAMEDFNAGRMGTIPALHGTA
jgi:redox-sensitive bicupin YhaK (pirin superfamily)